MLELGGGLRPARDADECLAGSGFFVAEGDPVVGDHHTFAWRGGRLGRRGGAGAGDGGDRCGPNDERATIHSDPPFGVGDTARMPSESQEGSPRFALARYRSGTAVKRSV